MITPDVLRSVPLFAALEESCLAEIAATAADIHLLQGEWLIREGELPAFYVLLSGEMEVTKFVAGVEQEIAHYQAGDYFGEVPLLLSSPAIANVRAETDVRVLRLEAEEFHSLITRSEKLAAGIVQTMTRRVTYLQQRVAETPQERILIVGHPADLACHDLRQFLSGNHVSFRWLDPGNPNVVHSIPEEVKKEPYPAVVLTDGSVLRNPSNREVAQRLGLQTVPQQAEYDVVIVGGGPAGLAAAVYGASEGLRTLMVEREAPGGQAGTSSRIENYLGFPTGLSGDELGVRALQQAKRFGTEIVVARSVQALRLASKENTEHQENTQNTNRLAHEILLDEEVSLKARTVILATGVSWRTLGVEGAEALIGRGIYYGAARTEAISVRGKDVYLIGGGNSAGQAAMFFSSYARCVTLLIRAASIEAGMSQYLIDQIATKDNVIVRLNTNVVAVHGQGHLEAITVQNSGTRDEEPLSTDSMFVFIGADAVTGWLPDEIARDARGYILTGTDAQNSGKWTLERDPYLLETGVPGIFAAGDVRHGSVKRVASGVGEGSMAIAFIHQYLALQSPSAPPDSAPPAAS